MNTTTDREDLIVSIRFKCVQCNKKLSAAEDRAGQLVQCPACKQEIRIPAGRPSSPTESAPGEPDASPAQPWLAWCGAGAAVLVAVVAVVFALAARAQERRANEKLDEAEQTVQADAATIEVLKREARAADAASQALKERLAATEQEGTRAKIEAEAARRAEKGQRDQATRPAAGGSGETPKPPAPRERVPGAPGPADTSRLAFASSPSRELAFAEPEVVTFSPDGKQLVAAGANAAKEPVLMVWNTETWAKEREIPLQGTVAQLAFTPDHKWLVVTSGKDDRVCLLDTVSFTVKHVLVASGWVISFSISSDGKTLACMPSSDWKVQIWDLSTQKVIQTLSEEATLTTCIVHSPDGKYLAGTGQKVRVWNLATGALEKTLTRQTDQFAGFFGSISPDSKKLAVSCNDSRVRIWDLQTGQLQKTFEAEQPNLISVQYSPDGRTLLTRSIKGVDASDKTSILLARSSGSDMCIWNAATGSMARLGHDVCFLKPHGLAFSPDGKTIAATRDQAIGIWIGTMQPEDAPVGASAPGSQDKDEAAKKELEKLRGVWVCIGFETKGQLDISAGALTAMLHEVMTIKGDQLSADWSDTLLGSGTRSGPIKVNPTAIPKELDFTPEKGVRKDLIGKSRLGVYEVDGDKLKISWGDYGGKDRPKSLATRNGDTHRVDHYVRKK